MTTKRLSDCEREILKLTDAMNERYKTKLTTEQVETWVGSDTPLSEICDLVHEVKDKNANALTPEDVLALCEDVA